MVTSVAPTAPPTSAEALPVDLSREFPKPLTDEFVPAVPDPPLEAAGVAVSVTKTLVESACDSCGVRLPEVAGADRWRAAYCRHRPGILEPDPETCGLTLTLEGSMA